MHVYYRHPSSRLCHGLVLCRMQAAHHIPSSKCSNERLRAPMTGDPSQTPSLACGEDATRRATASPRARGARGCRELAHAMITQCIANLAAPCCTIHGEFKSCGLWEWQDSRPVSTIPPPSATANQALELPVQSHCFCCLKCTLCPHLRASTDYQYYQAHNVLCSHAKYNNFLHMKARNSTSVAMLMLVAQMG